ncbi:PIN domain-containing protein [Streptomyces griseoviridis]|uniref:type II toxin-antitoxin system VapC family toxin n=1 Tax=Streptomyces griseoviridis TaxID=45398 RepID=UPI0033D0D7F1
MKRRLFAVADTSVLLAVYNRKDHHHETSVHALSLVDRIVVSPMVLAELDYHLTRKISGRAAADALASMRAWAGTNRLTLASVGWPLLAEAERLMRRYADQDAIGITDAVNAALAWTLPQPVVLALDHHYRDVIAPRTATEQPLQVLPAQDRSR